MTPRRLRSAPIPFARVAALALVACLAAGCTADESGSGSTSSDDKGPSTSTASEPTTTSPDAASAGASAATRPPVVGDCLEAMSATASEGTRLPEIVDCAGAHGGEIVALYELAGGADAKYPAAGRSVEGADDLYARCQGPEGDGGDFGDFVGDNRLKGPADLTSEIGVGQAWVISGILSAAYVPGPAAWERGERWFACAAVASTALNSLTTYEGSLKGLRGKRGELPAALAWCKLQPESADRDNFESVSCLTPHNYEQVASVEVVESSDTHPGDEALNALSEEICQPLIAEATGGKWTEGDGTHDIGWTYPVASDWEQGARIVRCFVVTLDGNSTGSASSGTIELES